MPKFPASHVKDVEPSRLGLHGITYGDGTRDGSGSIAQLDPVKDVSLLKWFPNSFVSDNGRSLVVRHLPRFFKELPPLDESESYSMDGWPATSRPMAMSPTMAR